PGLSNLQQRQLRALAVELNARFDLDDVLARDFLRHDLEFRPHAGFDGAGAVAQLKPQIRLPFLGIAQLFGANQEEACDGLFARQVRDKRFFHWPEASPERLPNRRNFLWPFFAALVASGVAFTS